MSHQITNFYQLNELFTFESHRQGRALMGVGSFELYAWQGALIQNHTQYLQALHSFYTSLYINGYKKDGAVYSAKYEIPESNYMEFESKFDSLFEGELNLNSLLN